MHILLYTNKLSSVFISEKKKAGKQYKIKRFYIAYPDRSVGVDQKSKMNSFVSSAQTL